MFIRRPETHLRGLWPRKACAIQSRAKPFTHFTVGSYHAARTGEGSEDEEEAPQECGANEGEGQGTEECRQAGQEELSDGGTRDLLSTIGEPFEFGLDVLLGKFRDDTLNRLFDGLFRSGPHNVICEQGGLLQG